MDTNSISRAKSGKEGQIGCENCKRLEEINRDLYEALKEAATTIHNMIRGTEGGYREFLQAQVKEISVIVAKVGVK